MLSALASLQTSSVVLPCLRNLWPNCKTFLTVYVLFCLFIDCLNFQHYRLVCGRCGCLQTLFPLHLSVLCGPGHNIGGVAWLSGNTLYIVLDHRVLRVCLDVETLVHSSTQS